MSLNILQNGFKFNNVQTLSLLNTYSRSVRAPPPGWQRCHWLWAHPHTHDTWLRLHLKTQKAALWLPIAASCQGKEWEDTHWEAWQLPQRESPVPPSFSRGELGEEGEGTGRCHLVLYCCFVFPASFCLPCYYP